VEAFRKQLPTATAERGKPLSRAIDSSIKAALERYATTQAVVLMPLHPRLLAAVRPAGWEERPDEVMTNLREIQSSYGFGLLDCSDLATLGRPRAVL
jgi:hypothetical protein